MAEQKSIKKRRASTAGVKALIATASVAATLAGWAVLPGNDPQVAAGAGNPSDQLPALSAPGPDNNGSLNTFPQFPNMQSPDSELPQVQLPQSSPNFPGAFTRSHSSR